MNNFRIAFTAVLPFICYLFFGGVLRQARLVDQKFLFQLNKVLFKAFFPVLMFRNIIRIEGGTALSLRMVLFAVFVMLGLVAVLMVFIPRIESKDSRRGVIIQAIYRGNFVLFALPLTESIFGEAGSAMGSLMMIVSIPVYNILAVIVLSIYSGKKPSFLSILKDIASNPLIDGILVGIVFNLLPVTMPEALMTPLNALANCTTPMAICVLGARLTVQSIKGNEKIIALSCFLKLVIIPLLITGLAVLLGIRGLEWFLLFIYFGAPTAVSSVSMAENMGGDGELAGQLVVFTTLLSLISIFCWILIARGVGLI